MNQNWRAIDRVGHAAGLSGDSAGRFDRVARKVLKETTRKHEKSFASFNDEFLDFLQTEVFPDKRIIQVLEEANVDQYIIKDFEEGRVHKANMTEDDREFRGWRRNIDRGQTKNTGPEQIIINIPENVSITSEPPDFNAEGPCGAVSKRLWYPDIDIYKRDGSVVLECMDMNSKTKSVFGTFESHIHNAIQGVKKGWKYEMEIHYEHFPFQITVQDHEVVIENFLGEKSPRTCVIMGDTEVQVYGEKIDLIGPDKEHVGQTAANIEQATKVPEKDERTFRDGAYIVEKGVIDE